MTFLEFCRNRGFWILDSVRGGDVKKYYGYLKKYSSKDSNPKEVIKYQKSAVSELLCRVRKNVPYYSKMASLDLHSWPVITKMTINQNKESFLSKEYKEDELYKMYTSGSTGTPFLSLQNVEKKRHVNAETVYYLGLQGYKVGQRIIFLRSIVDECKKSWIAQFAENIYQVSCNDLSDAGISKMLSRIAKLSRGCGAVLIAYASTYDALRLYFDRNGDFEAKKCKIHSITSGSEMLYDCTRITMEKAFGCKCYSRYANEENGFLGQDGVENNVFFQDFADYYIEILKFDSDDSAEYGEQGRIVVTDLFNYAQPMIRYDTGDVGAFVDIKDGVYLRRAIGDFGGRAVDKIYATDGNLISPHAITNAMWSFKQVRQFKFIQKGQKKYEIQLNLDTKKVFDEAMLKKSIKKILGEDAEIVFLYIDEVPVLASGKRRYIENQWQRESKHAENKIYC